MTIKILPVLLISVLVLVAGCTQADQKTSTYEKTKTTAGSGSSAAPQSPVVVSDQPIKDGAVIIAKVSSSGPGWIVIHADKDDGPGPSIGQTAVKDGDNTNVVVKIDGSKATTTLYAMLHKDVGKVGVFEFPGPDVPVTVGDVVGEVVAPAFKVTS